MSIETIEKNINRVTDDKYLSIIELIVNAVREYPLFGLNDTEKFFKEVKRIINKEEITLDFLKSYVDNSDKKNKDNIWVTSSLGSLIEPFNLMNLYNISFQEVLDKIKELN